MKAKILDVLNMIGEDPVLFIEVEGENHWTGLMVAGKRQYPLSATKARELALILNNLAISLDTHNKEGSHGN